MKKILTFLLAAGTVSGCLAGDIVFPLEWNKTYRTDVPYEVEIDRSKLAEISGSSADCGFKVFAETAGKKTPLAVQLLPGREKKLVSLRFDVPAGTEKLECAVAGKGDVKASAENLFAGMLNKENIRRWECAGSVKVTSVSSGIVISHTGEREGLARYTVDVPPEFAGRAVRMEFDVKSLTPLPWSNNNRIEQLDANGKVLPEGAVRQEWISHLRPFNVKTCYRENGRIHPDAKKLRLVLRIISPIRNKKAMGLDGLPVKDLKKANPKLEISHFSLRKAEQLPFPKYNDRFFVPGVSGKSGDFAISLSKDCLFSYNTASQAVWGDAFQVKDPKQLFFPIGAAGTVEFYIKPDKWKYARRNTVTLIDAYNVIGMAGGRMIPRRNAIFELCYRPVRKQLTLTLKDGKDNVFKKSATAEIKAGEWTHLAAQWSEKGVQIFVNGKCVLNDDKFKFAPLDIASMQYTNGYIPMQVTLATATPKLRNAGNYSQATSPDFCGAVDLLRSSDIARYEGDFVPQKSFTVDEATRSLLDFDRSFDGVSGGGCRHLTGAVKADIAMIDRYLNINGTAKPYMILKNLQHNDPSKVLDAVNYPVVPKVSDFVAARKTQTKEFFMQANKSIEFEMPEKVFTDYVEIINTDKTRSLVSPVVINDGEADTRSFADIAESLKLEGKFDRQKVEDLFRFVLARSDYYMSHQAYIPDGNDYANIVENYPLAMLNGYCGFECGPLNLLTSSLFTASGKCPSRMIGAYAHAYEGVFYDGRTRIYDLSAQKFFPSWDNTNAATQDEIDAEVGLMQRVNSNPNHFMRLTTRGGQYINSAGLMAKAGVIVKPQERLRIYTANNGIQNDLQCDKRVNVAVYKQDKTEESGIIVGANPNRMYKVDRFFPHVSTGFLNMDCVPLQNLAAFTDIKKDSFCYKVVSSYPIVRGSYAAYDKNGKPVRMTFITNKGKRERTFEMGPDGRYELDYEVRARHELLFRINAPISSIAKFSAETQFIRNPRIFTGNLRKGNNKLIFKEVNNLPAKVKIAYRTDAKEIVVAGGVYTGAIPGFERQLFVAEPGRKLVLDVSNVSGKAKVTAYGKVAAKLANGKLEITPAAGSARFGEVVINDDGAVKKITLLIAEGARLLTAKDFTAVRNAELLKADKTRVQDCIMLKDQGECKVKFDSLPAGKYAVWNLNRFESHIAFIGLAPRPLHMILPGKKSLAAGSAINHAADFYKAQYGRAGERSRFKWDFPIDPATQYWAGLPQMLDLPTCSELSFKCVINNYKGIELAAVLIVPEPTVDFRNDMVKILCGLNCEPFLRSK